MAHFLFSKDRYQLRYSQDYKPQSMYDAKKREMKAMKGIAVLKDYLGNLERFSLLDIGCSTGLMTQVYGRFFAAVTAIDIDESAISFAQKHNGNPQLKFFVRDALDTRFSEGSFDVITCTQIYEHVPDSQLLMREIFRLLKRDGVCYFTAINRINFLEPHYHLPLLSVLPRFLAHRYLRCFRGIDFYYETPRTFWGLKRLVSSFEIVDYTLKVIASPGRFYATDVIKENTRFHLGVKLTSRWLYPILPTYIWILKKPGACPHREKLPH